MVAKSDFPDASRASSVTDSGSTAAQTGLSRSGAATSSVASSAGKIASASGSPVVAAAPPAKTGNTASSFKARGATLGAFVAVLGAALSF